MDSKHTSLAEDSQESDWYSESSPGNAVDAAGALQRWWFRRMVIDKRWKKHYTLERWALVFLVTLTMYNAVGGWVPGRPIETILTGGLVILFIVVRIHLASLPAINANYDFIPASWSSFRAAPIQTSEVFRAMYTHAWWFTVVPFVVLGFIEILLFETISGTEPIQLNLVRFIMVIGNLTALGFIMSAIAYIGGQIWRSSLGILLALVVPIVVWVFAGMGPFLSGFFGFSAPETEFQLAIVSLIVIPEVHTAGSLVTESFTPPGFKEPTTLFDVWITLVITAVILWNALHLILDARRRRG